MTRSSYKPKAGRFLISEPFMSDQNFQRTVVFLVEHGKEGSLGFVINRRLDLTVDQLIEGIPAFNAPVFMGGPVEQNTLHYVHRLGDVFTDGHEIFEGVFWGGDFEQVKEKIRLKLIKKTDVLFFVGYSGWGPGQLEYELDQKSWIVAPKNVNFIFQNDYADLWRQVLQSMGPKYHIISNYPIDPRLN